MLRLFFNLPHCVTANSECVQFQILGYWGGIETVSPLNNKKSDTICIMLENIIAIKEKNMPFLFFPYFLLKSSLLPTFVLSSLCLSLSNSFWCSVNQKCSAKSRWMRILLLSHYYYYYDNRSIWNSVLHCIKWLNCYTAYE